MKYIKKILPPLRQPRTIVALENTEPEKISNNKDCCCIIFLILLLLVLCLGTIVGACFIVIYFVSSQLKFCLVSKII